MLFAFMASDAVLLAVIGIVAFVVKDILEQRRERLREEREIAKEEREIARANKLSAAVQEVHTLSNKMKDELVNEVRRVGEVTAVAEHAKGVIEGKNDPMPEATVKGREVGSGEGAPQNLDADAIQEITGG